MHDVVAHHMSMIAVQAETAPYRVPGLPDAARAEFTALGDSARAALTDMRRLLGALRSPETLRTNPGPERVPQPELSDVPELVDAVRGAGAEVTLEMAGRLPEVPGVVGLAAYRIVQESLSNAGRHAPGAAIRVSVGEGDGSVLVDVTNGPPGAAFASPAARPATQGEPEPPGSGQGLAGMRERVALLGGEFQAGPRADGGYAVRASLPIGDDRRPPGCPGSGAAP
jgi:signal transduction histidine kinase